MRYKSVPTTPAACGGTGSSVKSSENWSHPIPSISLGRHTITFKDHNENAIMRSGYGVKLRPGPGYVVKQSLKMVM